MKNNKVINTITNEVYDAEIYQERKSSYLVSIKGVGLLPFSKKTGNIFGKYLQHNPYKLLSQTDEA